MRNCTVLRDHACNCYPYLVRAASGGNSPCRGCAWRRCTKLNSLRVDTPYARQAAVTIALDMLVDRGNLKCITGCAALCTRSRGHAQQLRHKLSTSSRGLLVWSCCPGEQQHTVQEYHKSFLQTVLRSSLQLQQCTQHIPACNMFTNRPCLSRPRGIVMQLLCAHLEGTGSVVLPAPLAATVVG
jgi:hypothetical protein